MLQLMHALASALVLTAAACAVSGTDWLPTQARHLPYWPAVTPTAASSLASCSACAVADASKSAASACMVGTSESCMERGGAVVGEE